MREFHLKVLIIIYSEHGNNIICVIITRYLVLLKNNYSSNILIRHRKIIDLVESKYFLPYILIFTFNEEAFNFRMEDINVIVCHYK